MRAPTNGATLPLLTSYIVFSEKVVILNKSDYTTKMNSILDDASKFENLCSVEENDNTLTIEKRIQCRLLELLNGNIIQQAVYNDIRSSGLL